MVTERNGGNRGQIPESNWDGGRVSELLFFFVDFFFFDLSDVLCFINCVIETPLHFIFS